MSDEDDPGSGTGGFSRLVVVSNRLPVVLERQADGSWRAERGAGGLVTAMEPVLQEHSGLWMGWPGIEEEVIPTEEANEALAAQSRDLGYDLKGIGLTARERDDFYLGFSNQVIWPLFHDFPDRCNFDTRFWEVYTAVNRKFAAAVGEEARDGDFLWIHDYHLVGVAQGLRRRGVELPMGFFLHIPFPSLDLFLKLPWRFPILRSLLHYDLLGFQTARDRENFFQVLRALIPDAGIDEGERLSTVQVGDHTLRVGVFPISIDFEDFDGLARSGPVEERSRELQDAFRNLAGDQPRPTTIILGVDRLDYSKGIPHKLRGLQQALTKYPELRGEVTLVQLIVPSREDIPEYHELKEEVDRLVGEIEGEFSRPGWSPVQYQYGEWDREELLAHYRAARIALVTPLKDGMNLVAKEFCAASPDDQGVLILSEHAGAGAQLQEGALLVNPYDVEEVAEAIHRAWSMDEEERRRRMAILRDQIRERDIHWWVRTFLEAARDGRVEDGILPRYRPSLPDGYLDAFSHQTDEGDPP
jgi:trehalose 6-phosphate synthase/phosphatase